MKSMLNIHASQPPLFVFCFINNTKALLWAIHQCASALTYLQKVVTSQLRPYSCHEYHHLSRYWILLVAQIHQMCSVMSEHSNSPFPDIDSPKVRLLGDCYEVIVKLLSCKNHFPETILQKACLLSAMSFLYAWSKLL